MNTNDIRNKFLDFFKDKNHEIVDSSNIIPKNDNTLMFTNSGMVQFKNVFTGKDVRDYTRASTAQMCLRAGGKHNDLDNVGYTARHHTFFEMLGNFSFGDYFKEDAIKYSWEFLTDVLGIDKSKLYVTVYHTDDDAYKIWNEIVGVDASHIIKIDTNDNFWSMGDVGPCGPCSEIFYDHGEHIFGDKPGTENEDGDRFVEIWNLVFMQYEQVDGKMIDLPKPSIDTGMGIERIAAVLQGTHDNYEIDLFKNIIESAAKIIGVDKSHKSLRVVADHIRSISFLIAEGLLPSNEGEAYVLRRIIRRALRHIYIMDPNSSEPLLYKIVKPLVENMGDFYTHLKERQSVIENAIFEEEKRFKKTLNNGIKLLEEEQENVGFDKIFNGEVAFKLYDTFGFPLDLTQDILRANDIIVDIEEFDRCMDIQKKQSSNSSFNAVGGFNIMIEADNKFSKTEFVGYDVLSCDAKIIGIFDLEGKEHDDISNVSSGYLIFDKTPFYAESGGQVGDQGFVNDVVFITDCKKTEGGVFIHIFENNGNLLIGNNVELSVDKERRSSIAKNHSVTHLMHEAMTRVLGEHVEQKGSFQNDKLTRFDVSHNQLISEEEIKHIEQMVNEQIQNNSIVSVMETDLETAKSMGAMALFSEKYGDKVRLVSMGSKDDTGRVFSAELCGGTHVNNLGEIGGFKIISEASAASGIRRIEAITGSEYFKYNEVNNQILVSLVNLTKTNKEQLVDRVQKMMESIKSLEKKNVELLLKLESHINDNEINEINGVTVITKKTNIVSKDLKSLVSTISSKYNNSVVFIANEIEGKVSIICASNNDFNTVEYIKEVVGLFGGKGGGGKPNLCQAGGTTMDGFDDAVKLLKSKI